MFFFVGGEVVFLMVLTFGADVLNCLVFFDVFEFS